MRDMCSCCCVRHNGSSLKHIINTLTIQTFHLFLNYGNNIFKPVELSVIAITSSVFVM